MSNTKKHTKTYHQYKPKNKSNRPITDAYGTPHRCSYKKMFRKYAANLQENTHVEVLFQSSCKATILKSHFSMSVLL